MVDTGTGNIEFPVHDANGNIHGLTDRATGQITAAYEFSPFGETLRATGSYAQANPFRFSSKFTDNETDHVHYGRRYYNPALGRFLGRDPIAEKGGLHLYAFAGNNGINRWDYLGMDPQLNYGGYNTNPLSLGASRNHLPSRKCCRSPIWQWRCRWNSSAYLIMRFK